MANIESAKQFSFRLPEPLVEQLEQCTEHIRATGLEVTRADVVRLLLKHALEETHCDLQRLLGGPAVFDKKRAKKRRA